VLNRLNLQINELTQLLALERSTTQDREDSLANLQASLSASEAEKSRLEQLLAQGAGAGDAANRRATALSGELDNQRQIS
ncbi:MAG: peptidoglycan-binding protein, partial [Mesorhizobium sp.]